jgi:2-polyprenyl-3-methyl-5-hydroxy-6-metoxy-1,4-benzoquinol methylase
LKQFDVQKHYEELLAENYTWMFGGFGVKTEEQKAVLTHLLGGEEGIGGRAMDLGCGSGFQAIALAQLGCSVTAIDTSMELLKELEAHRGDLDIKTVHDSIENMSHVVREGDEKEDIIVCMGDTVTHLPSTESVKTMFHEAFELLRVHGRFVLSYRDLTHELKGTDRFLLVRNDESKIMTCFLEYEPQTVVVHDLIHAKGDDGSWGLKKSAYKKLRLSVKWVVDALKQEGFEVLEPFVKFGMSYIVAKRV